MVPGHALVMDSEKQFAPLAKFGSSFLNRQGVNPGAKIGCWGEQINNKALVGSKPEYNGGNGQNNGTILWEKTFLATDFNFQLALPRCSLASHLLTRLEF